MWKRWSLALLCLVLALSLAGCAKVNGDNSFQGAAPGGLDTQPVQTQAQTQPDGTQAPAAPTPEPTSDPNAGGYNG